MPRGRKKGAKGRKLKSEPVFKGIIDEMRNTSLCDHFMFPKHYAQLKVGMTAGGVKKILNDLVQKGLLARVQVAYRIVESIDGEEKIIRSAKDLKDSSDRFIELSEDYPVPEHNLWYYVVTRKGSDQYYAETGKRL